MIKAFTLICRRPDLSPEAFARHWRQVHAGIVMSVEALRPLRYVQNHFGEEAALYPDHPPVSGIAESWRRSLADLPKALHENETWLATVRPDELRFIDVAATCNVVAEERVVHDGDTTGHKLMVFTAGAPVADGMEATACRHVRNAPLPGRQLGLGGGAAPVAWTGIDEFWFADQRLLGEARRLISRPPASGLRHAVAVTEHLIHESTGNRQSA